MTNECLISLHKVQSLHTHFTADVHEHKNNKMLMMMKVLNDGKKLSVISTMADAIQLILINAI